MMLNIEWEFFVKGWMKWNVDVLFSGEVGVVMIGGVLRDQNFNIR